MVLFIEVRNFGRGWSDENCKFGFGYVGFMRYLGEDIEKVIDCMSLDFWERFEIWNSIWMIINIMRMDDIV